MIKAVIFDFGGVIGSDSDEWDGTFSEVCARSGLSKEDIEVIFWHHWHKMKYGWETTKEFWQDVYKKSPKKLKKGSLERLYEDSIQVDKQLLMLVKNLREKGFVVAILSNAAKEWIEAEIRRFKLDRIFDAIYVSCDLKMAKPDKKIFEFVIDDLGYGPGQIVFVDNLINNVEAARKLGIKAILFEGIKKLKKQLIELGVS